MSLYKVLAFDMNISVYMRQLTLAIIESCPDLTLNLMRLADDVESLALKATEVLGGIDIWVNNAGVSNTTPSDVTEIDPQKAQEVVATNLFGSLWGSRAAIAQMKTQISGQAYETKNALWPILSTRENCQCLTDLRYKNMADDHVLLPLWHAWLGLQYAL